MQTHFVFRQMESSDALRDYATERLAKINRYFADPLKVSCTFSVEKIHHVAQFEVTLRNGLQLHSSETTENMYSSIDMALAKMERQVRRYKDRIKNHKPHKGKAARVRQQVMAATSFDLTMDDVEGKDSQPDREATKTEIIRSKEFRAERLTAQQAVMQMNLMHKEFLVFTNIATHDINIVYRNDDEDYVLLETHGHVEDV